MSEAERQRLAAIDAPPRRAQFVAGRWLIRQVLAEAYGGDARTDWPLSTGHDGPPRLLSAQAHRGVDLGLHLGLSHSAAHVCCAIGETPVGIDIEDTRRSRDWAALAELVFTATERRDVAAQPHDRQPAYFYRVWTLKEAWLKCRQAGMSPDAMARLQAVAVKDALGTQPANAGCWRGDGFAMSLVFSAPIEIVWAGVVPAFDEAAVPWHVAET